jgi:3-hydroxyacyl-CoA dehydrogenase
MGGGIAQVRAIGGDEVVVYDIAPDALADAREHATTGRFGLDNAVARGKLTREDADVALARITFSFEEAAATDLVIEAVPERIDLKIRVFRDLDQAAPAHTILASNTSGFPIAAARRCGKNPVVVKDNPMEWGFVPNRVYFAIVREAQRVVDEGIATRDEVDQLMMDCYRWPSGPFGMVKGAGSGWS